MRLLAQGGRIHAPSSPHATAILLVDGEVAWLGSDAGAAVHAADAERVIDLRGALVTPAFVDSHVHHTGTGLALIGLDLRGVPSRAGLLERVAAASRLHPGGVVGHGWDESSWPDPIPPSHSQLDQAAGGAPVYLSRVDVHSALVSSALIAAAGIAGLPGMAESGWVTGAAHAAVRRYLSKSMPASLRERAQRATRAHAARHGVALLVEAAGPDINGATDLLALQELAAAEPGPELVCYWGDTDIEQAVELGAAGAAGDLFVDGAIGSRTAAWTQQYADAPTCGVLHLSADEVATHLISCTRAGIQGGFHAIGDAAIAVVVEGLQAAVAECGLPATRLARHRVEHGCATTPAQAAQFAAAGVVLSIQPQFDAAWGGPSGLYEARLGPQRAAGLHDFAGFARSGVMLALGSDAPVAPLDPWAAVRAAAWTHRAESRLSVRAAFNAATRGGWRAVRRDGQGVLAPGSPATLAVWEAGEIGVQVPEAAIRAWSTDARSGTPGLPLLDPGVAAPRALATLVRGQVVFSADPDWLGPADGN